MFWLRNKIIDFNYLNACISNIRSRVNEHQNCFIPGSDRVLLMGIKKEFVIRCADSSPESGGIL